MTGVGLATAYRHCRRIARDHYENFTVGSWLLPRGERRHLAAIYAFARGADDLADEGTLAPAERLRRLDAWERALEECFAGRAVDPVFVALAHTVRVRALDIEPFRRLLAAFRADVSWRGFETVDDLLGYCRCSADPVGHLVLALFGYRDSERRTLADKVCTGLQLANLWQDLGIDVGRGRVYLPRAELARFGCDPAALVRGETTPALRRLLAAEVARARHLLVAGRALAAVVRPRLAWEVRLFAGGGLAILDRIEAADFDVLARRPTLGRRERARVVAAALRPPRRSGPEGAAAAGSPLAGSPPAPAARRAAGGGQALAGAYAYCRQVTRRSSSNFAYAFHLLGPERRSALDAVYAFCRFVDDVADEERGADPAALLGRWRDELDRVYGGAPTHPIGVALADAVRRFPLERRHFEDLIAGVETDLRQRRWESFDALQAYCYRVASTVGLLCIEIFGYRRPSAREYAVDLGIAFQLTNILRDVREDARRGRIYLPLDDLARFGVDEAELLAGRYSPRLGALMAFECGRARAHYLRARAALAPEDRASLATAEAMRRIYQRLLARIEAREFDVFGPRVSLPRWEKAGLALAAWGRARWA